MLALTRDLFNHREEQSKHKVLSIDEWCMRDDVTQPEWSISLFSGQYHFSAVNITFYYIIDIQYRTIYIENGVC